MKIVPNDSKLVFAINILTVVTVFYCFLIPTVLAQRKNIIIPFFCDDVNVTGKIVLTLNAR